MNRDFNPVNPEIPSLMIQTVYDHTSLLYQRHHQLSAVLTIIQKGCSCAKYECIYILYHLLSVICRVYGILPVLPFAGRRD